MRIAIIAHLKHPIAQPFAGGMETFTHSLVQGLHRRGHEVTLFASGDSDRTLPVTPIVRRGTLTAARKHPESMRKRWIKILEDTAYRRLMLQLRDAPFDVIHNNSIHPIPLRFAGELASPMLTTLHVPPLPRLKEELRRGDQAVNHGSFVNISAANRGAWRSLVPDHPIVFNGIDTDYWRACGDAGNGRAVWFGRILPDKGTHHAINAAHRAGLSIDLLGSVEDEAYFASQVRPSLREDDRYHGRKDHAAVCKIVGAASVCLVTPCWDEPFGLVVAEALSCGTPVAAFDRGAMSELITPDVGRLAPAGDEAALAEATRACLLVDRRRCRDVAQERFSMQRMLDNYEQLYQSLSARVAA